MHRILCNKQNQYNSFIDCQIYLPQINTQTKALLLHFIIFNFQTYLSQIDAGDLSSRKKLRTDLKCHDFQWYISNIYPELYAPPKQDILFEGEVS